MAIKEFPRDYKFTIGQQLQDEIVGIVVLIYKANSAVSDRSTYVSLLLERIQVVELLIRLSMDMKLLPKKHYAALIEMTRSINKQSEGWKKSVTKIATKKL